MLKTPIVLAPDREAFDGWCAARGIAPPVAVYLLHIGQVWHRDQRTHEEVRLPGWEQNAAYTPKLLAWLEVWWRRGERREADEGAA